MRIAAARSASIGTAPASQAKVPAGGLGFLAMLTGLAMQPAGSSRSAIPDEPAGDSSATAGDESASQAGAAGTPFPAPALTHKEPDEAPDNLQSFIKAGAAIPKEHSPVPPQPGKGEIHRTAPGIKQPSQSAAIAIAAVSPAALVTPPTPGSALPFLRQEQSATLDEKPTAASAEPVGLTGKAWSGDTTAPAAGVPASQRDDEKKPQARGDQPVNRLAIETSCAAAQQSADAVGEDATSPLAGDKQGSAPNTAQGVLTLFTVSAANMGNRAQISAESAKAAAVSNASEPEDLNGASAAGDAKTKDNKAVVDANHAPVQGSTADNPLAQREDPHLSQAQAQASPDASRLSSTVAPQAAATAIVAGAHIAGAASGPIEPPSQAPHATGSPTVVQTAAPLAPSTVNAANLLQKMGETEMRVAMHSADFGPISISTSLSPQQMMAQITVDHGELGKALSAHVPAMESRLASELGVKSVVQVSQGAMSFSSGGGNSQHGGQRSFAAASPQSQIAAQLTGADETVMHLAAQAAADGRLDIQA